MEVAIVIPLWLLFGLGAVKVAANKGRSIRAWSALGLLLGPLSLLLIAYLPASRDPARKTQRCPLCGRELAQDHHNSETRVLSREEYEHLTPGQQLAVRTFGYLPSTGEADAIDKMLKGFDNREARSYLRDRAQKAVYRN